MARTVRISRIAPLALSLALLAGCRTVPLVDPPTIRGAETPELTRIAIARALIGSDYRVEEDAPGRIRGRYAESDWFMTVDVLYGRDVAIRYVDSGRLGYEVREGVPYIHKGYVARAQELLMSIQRELRRVAPVPPLAPTAPAP